jgi:hypothetical protein
VAKDKFDLMLVKYRELVATNSVKARAYYAIDYQNNFYLLKCIAQTYLEMLKNGSTKCARTLILENGEWLKIYIIKAFSINHDNAETFTPWGDKKIKSHDNTIYCFKRIIKLGVNTIAKQEYSRGRSFPKN